MPQSGRAWVGLLALLLSMTVLIRSRLLGLARLVGKVELRRLLLILVHCRLTGKRRLFQSKGLATVEIWQH